MKRYLVANFFYHGEQHKAAVVELTEEGEFISWAPLSSFPCEPAGTVYKESLHIE